MRLGEKLHIWFKYAVENFPKAKIIGKIDDDTFVCAKHMYQTLKLVEHPYLYYGLFHHFEKGYTQFLEEKSNNDNDNSLNLTVDNYYRMDEMFALIGHQAAKKIASMQYCPLDTHMKGMSFTKIDQKIVDKCFSKNQVPDTNFGGNSLGLWLNFIQKNKINKNHSKLDNDNDDQALQVIWDNDRIIHHIRDQVPKINGTLFPGFCENFVIYHKATAAEMTLLDSKTDNQWN